MNPSNKRLAVLVEDHPVGYIGFEGDIPDGNYGAGTVEIWDCDTCTSDPEFEDIHKAFEAGLIEFYLERENLKGKFILVRMEKSNVENGWLLIKKSDQFAVARNMMLMWLHSRVNKHLSDRQKRLEQL